jgi:hypothetical protein
MAVFMQGLCSGLLSNVVTEPGDIAEDPSKRRKHLSCFVVCSIVLRKVGPQNSGKERLDP